MILIFRYPRHRKIVSFDDANKLSISRERHSMRDIIPIIRLYVVAKGLRFLHEKIIR